MLKRFNLGQLVSLVHCKKCTGPVEILPSEEETICPYCDTTIDLVCDNTKCADNKGGLKDV